MLSLTRLTGRLENLAVQVKRKWDKEPVFRAKNYLQEFSGFGVSDASRVRSGALGHGPARRANSRIQFSDALQREHAQQQPAERQASDHS